MLVIHIFFGYRSRTAYHSQCVLCVVFILHVTSSSATDCSRSESGQARSIIGQNVIPRFQIKHVDLQSTCPLSPASDRFAKHDRLKRPLGSNWMCSVCGKSFGKETELDNHLINAHSSIDDSTPCLADYCDILRCDAFFHPPDKKPACDQTHMAELKMKCINTVKHCIPSYLSEPGKLELEVSLLASLCEYLHCDHYWNVPDIDDHPEVSYYYFTYGLMISLLVLLMFIYFYVVSRNIESGVTMEQYVARGYEYKQQMKDLLPPKPDMEIRRREVPKSNTDRQWSEYE